MFVNFKSIGLFGVVIACCLSVSAQGKKFKASQPSSIISHKTNEIYPSSWSLNWMNEPWSGDDHPFIQSRKELDGLLRTKKLNAIYRESLKNDYYQDSEDSVKLYKWAYAVSIFPGNPQRRDVLIRFVTDYYWRVESPKSYEFARMRWLCHSVFGGIRNGDREKITKFGERLLQRNPNDYFVLYHMIDYASADKSVIYGRRMVALHPRKVSAHGSLAVALMGKFLQTHSERDANAAVIAHHRWLVMTPATDQRSRKSIVRTIQHIREVRARYAGRVS